jgi:hypothetical protein
MPPPTPKRRLATPSAQLPMAVMLTDVDEFVGTDGQLLLSCQHRPISFPENDSVYDGIPRGPPLRKEVSLIGSGAQHREDSHPFGQSIELPRLERPRSVPEPDVKG